MCGTNSSIVIPDGFKDKYNSGVIVKKLKLENSI